MVRLKDKKSGDYKLENDEISIPYGAIKSMKLTLDNIIND